MPPESAPRTVRYLLDSNILSDLIRHTDGRVAQHIRRVGETQVCTSIVVAAELRYGVAKKASPRLTAAIDGLLRRLEVLPWQAPVDQVYAELRAQLETRGRPIGANDLLIAAHAVTLGCTMVTDNEREFAAIRELRCENWLRR